MRQLVQPRLSAVAVVLAVTAAVTACGGSVHPKVTGAPVAREGTAPAASVTRAMYARVRPGTNPFALSKFLDTKIEVDPAAYGLYYRVPERLVAVMLSPLATPAQVDALHARLRHTGWFSKILIGGSQKVPDAIFATTTSA